LELGFPAVGHCHSLWLLIDRQQTLGIDHQSKIIGLAQYNLLLTGDTTHPMAKSTE
jgi:hypothetical protein